MRRRAAAARCFMCGHVFRQAERRYSAEAMPVGGDVPAKQITVCRGCFLELADDEATDDE